MSRHKIYLRPTVIELKLIKLGSPLTHHHHQQRHISSTTIATKESFVDTRLSETFIRYWPQFSQWIEKLMTALPATDTSVWFWKFTCIFRKERIYHILSSGKSTWSDFLQQDCFRQNLRQDIKFFCLPQIVFNYSVLLEYKPTTKLTLHTHIMMFLFRLVNTNCTSDLSINFQ